MRKKNYEEKLQFILYFVLFVFGIYLALMLLLLADARDTIRNVTADCVSFHAEREGFAGNSKEAWENYYDLCTR